MNQLHGRFMYFRTSPRGNVKFGITTCPWERCRQFQQGTDEIVSLDYVYLITGFYPKIIERIEQDLNCIYSSRCLFKQTNRAGHTEWYSNIDHEEWLKHLLTRSLVGPKGTHVQLIARDYTATRSSLCPEKIPTGTDSSTQWIRQNWHRFKWLELT